ncbi:DUF3871 family protein [Flavihumibacter profundi]|uniref:DUF3871 family protein n=1 Tax=Flavihumibacter profundi TaxID=2716883 RepID=UPI001CC68EFD|nr:DUF3871 family protein [Flavihumibacter profundi]MBZ5857767.1 DUF3871 family protein [Flavihumibacter profundi]
METEIFNREELALIDDRESSDQESSSSPFIIANTVRSSLSEIKASHVIPVFIKDNEPVISHSDFIECTQSIVADLFAGEIILKPSVRLSHPVKGRIPEAKQKPANQLLEHEKTLYFERMAFAIEIASIQDTIAGNTLSLTIGGVKAYNLDNLYHRKGADEHFKIFVGFQNKVCTNLCVWSDGYISDLKVKNASQLKASIRSLVENYNAHKHISALQKLANYELTEQQFAILIGRCRMYNNLPQNQRNEITPLLLSDTQLGSVVKDYYRDNSFCKAENGNINLWKLYNLLTGSNKSSYIDTFLDRSSNAFQFAHDLGVALERKETNWFLN